jgi:hypothetical protein
MTASSSLWLLKYVSNSSYSITIKTSSKAESDSITDIEGSYSSFMEVTLYFIVFMSP